VSAEVRPLLGDGTRIIGVELRFQTREMREELAVLPCNIVLPRQDPYFVRELSCTLHTSEGDIGFTLDLDRGTARSGA
jgi:hypothetical protein